MNVLIVTRGYFNSDTFLGGNFEMDQSRALRSYGHDVRVLVIDVRSFLHRRKFGIFQLEYEGFKVYLGSLPGGRLPFCLLNMLGKTAVNLAYDRIKDRWTPDIVHGHFTNVGYWASGLKRKCSAKSIITEHSSTVNRDIVQSKVKKQMLLAYSSNDHVIAVSRALAEKIKLHTGISATIIPNVLDYESFVIKESDFQKKPKGNNETFSFVCTANLNKGKKIDILLKAFAKIKDKQTKLTIFGDGKEFNALVKESQALKIDDRVFFMGHCSREQLCAEYKKSDCFVLPSASETFGVAYIEAMYMGLPVIATRCGGPEDFVVEENGILIEVDQVDELANAMEYMIKYKNMYDPKTIHEYVASRFSSKVIAEKLTKLYRHVLEDFS